MNKLLLLLSLLLFSFSVISESANASSQCRIDLVKKTHTGKTSYTLNGDSISAKVIEKLSPQCDFDIRLMTSAEKRAFDINRLKVRLAKLQRSIK